MLSYTCIGTNDLPKAAAFYDALFSILGAQRAFTMDRGIAWGVGHDKPMFSVMNPLTASPPLWAMA
jgi:catechol 2,3-dioxygenase-like lactoylglutathione lyase family enzyme